MINRVSHNTILAFIATIAWTFCAYADDVQVMTARGSTSATAMPKSIVVYDVAAIDTLDALGVRMAGIPDNIFVSYLDHVTQNMLPVGTLFEPDYEALVNLAPDLIIAGGRSSELVGPLSAIAPAIDMTIWGEGFVKQAIDRLDAFSLITGTEHKAVTLKSAFYDKIEQVKFSIAGKGTGLILLVNGPKISVYGAGSRFGWLHKTLGLPEAVPVLGNTPHGEVVSFEFISETNPDWLVVIDRGAALNASGESAAQVLDNELIGRTNAWSNGQVVYLNAADVYIAGGGYQSMMRTMNQMIAAFE